MRVKNIFRERLRELRQEKGVSTRGLGSAIGSTSASISEWERGERTPRIESLVLLSRFFGVTVGYLVGEEN